VPPLVAEPAVSSSSDAGTAEVSETPKGQMGVARDANPQDRLTEGCEPNAGSFGSRDTSVGGSWGLMCDTPFPA
jgi:hypothetical protein